MYKVRLALYKGGLAPHAKFLASRAKLASRASFLASDAKSAA